MCHLWWTPAHLRQKACNQKYELATQRDRTRAFELIQNVPNHDHIPTKQIYRRREEGKHLKTTYVSGTTSKTYFINQSVPFTFSICLLSSCSLLSLISPIHLIRQVMDSKFPCWICRGSWDCKASGRECATLSALHCFTVPQYARLCSAHYSRAKFARL